jgi:hypothetical protein
MSGSTNTVTPAQKEALIQKYWDINTNYDDWHQSVYESFKADMKAIGIEVWRMYFTGFCSQGDGACFEGTLDDTLKYLDHHHQGQYPMIRKLLENGGCVYARCEHRGRYYHQYCTEFWVDSDTLTGMIDQPTEFHELIVEQWQSQLEDEMGDFEKDIIEQWRSYMQDLYRKLEAEHDYLTSDEAVWDTIEANELYDWEDFEDEAA